jgi:hypothetical protein
LLANKLTVSGMGRLEAEKRKCPTSKEGGAAKRHRGEGSCHSQEERPKETAQSQGADRGKGEVEAVVKRKRPLSEGGGAAKKHRGEGLGGVGEG